jgi:tellurite resistance protein TerC
MPEAASRLRGWLARLRRGPVNYRWARRIAVGLVGGTVLLIGIALLVLPGPALVVIPVGLAILGLEFAWARLWLRKVKQRSSDLIGYFRTGGK